MKSLSCVASLLLLALLRPSLAGTDLHFFSPTLDQQRSSSEFVIEGRIVGSIDYTNMSWPLASFTIDCLIKGQLTSQIRVRGLGSTRLGTFGFESGVVFIHSCDKTKTECVVNYPAVSYHYTTEEIKKHFGINKCSSPETTIKSEPSLPDSCQSCKGSSDDPKPCIASVHSASGKRLCDGTLIGDKWILTAARCVQASHHRPLRVHLSQTANFTVKSIQLHPKYTQRVTRHNYDAALLELAAAPPSCFTISIPFGKTKPAKKATCVMVSSNAPATTPVAGTARRQCKDARLRKSIFSMASSAGTEEAGSFASPLVCRAGKGKPWEQYGIASAADNCAKRGYVAFATPNAPRIGNWLKRVLKS